MQLQQNEFSWLVAQSNVNCTELNTAASPPSAAFNHKQSPPLDWCAQLENSQMSTAPNLIQLLLIHLCHFSLLRILLVRIVALRRGNLLQRSKCQLHRNQFQQLHVLLLHLLLLLHPRKPFRQSATWPSTARFCRLLIAWTQTFTSPQVLPQSVLFHLTLKNTSIDLNNCKF